MVTASQDVCDQKFFGSHEKTGTSSSASGIQEAATKRQWYTVVDLHRWRWAAHLMGYRFFPSCSSRVGHTRSRS